MMKRELAAAILLAFLIGVSVWDIKKVDSFTSDIEIALCKSQTAAEQLDFKGSREYMSEALKLWSEAENYMDCYISHAQISSTTEAFYTLQELLSHEDASACAPSYNWLKTQLQWIRESEKPSLGSIF